MADDALRAALLRIISLPPSRYRQNGCASPDPWVRKREVDRIARAALAAATPERGLDTAWRECEAALPEGWVGPSLWQDARDGWLWRAAAHEFSVLRPMPVTVKSQPTPIAALDALRVCLAGGDGA